MFKLKTYYISQTKKSSNPLTTHPDDAVKFDAIGTILASVRKGIKPGDAAKPVYEKLGLKMPSAKSISQAIQGWGKSLVTAANDGNSHAAAAIKKHLSDQVVELPEPEPATPPPVERFEVGSQKHVPTKPPVSRPPTTEEEEELQRVLDELEQPVED